MRGSAGRVCAHVNVAVAAATVINDASQSRINLLIHPPLGIFDERFNRSVGWIV
jgi:hypothetical protein